jgi:hypothetical protein
VASKPRSPRLAAAQEKSGACRRESGSAKAATVAVRISGAGENPLLLIPDT